MTKKYNKLLMILGILIYLCLRSRYYSEFFLRYNSLISFSIQPIAGTYICCLIGFYLSLIKIFDIVNNNIKKYIFLLFLYLLFLIKYFHIYIRIIFAKWIFSACLFVSFAILPFGKIKNNIFFFICQISRYTGGIYYLHIYINSILEEYILFKFTHGTIQLCIINYLICFIGTKFLKNTNFKYLFI